jgi:hypothetical protein
VTPCFSPAAHGKERPVVARVELSATESRRAPARPQLPPRGVERLNPFVVLGLAFLAGQLLARAIDWRSHAHPRD